MAVEGENDLAFVYLGLCYRDGKGVEQDVGKAVELFREAAARESSHGQVELGTCFRTGFGVEENLDESVKLFRLAADAGNNIGRLYLGYCFRDGDGVEQNYEEAATYSVWPQKKVRAMLSILWGRVIFWTWRD